MNKKRIAWITATCFLDTDIYIVPLMQKYFDIDWYILRKENEKIDYSNELKKLKDNVSHFEYIPIGRRNSSPDALVCYIRFMRRIKRGRYDLVYTAMGNMPFYTPVLGLCMNPKNIVLGIHNVTVLQGGSHPRLEKFYNWFAINRFKNFHAYSQVQYEELKKRVKQKNVLYAPFLLKDYGKAKHERTDTRITFLGYGNIRRYKRLDVLIDATERAYAQVKIPFRVIIAGSSDNWSEYQKHIIHQELFDTRIGRIPNEDIPELFVETDYVVMPYESIAQSGAMMVAMNYEKPVLASKLKAFEEYIEDGKNGVFFSPANVDELTEKMVYILENHENIYPEFKENFKEIKQNKFNTDQIVKKYKDYFEKVISVCEK